MLQQDKTPEAEARLENLNELINAAAEAQERGESLADFLDHAALVADVDSYDEKAPVTLMTLHNAKGLEFPLVFLSGMEQGLFPHSRSMDSEAAMEEERRLCYVGMTRARKRLILTWAKYRRRFGGGEQERSTASGFLSEVPELLMMNLGPADDDGEVNLHAERYDVRQSAKRGTYTGKTYNSLDNIKQFFGERGMPFKPAQAPPKPDLRTPPQFPRPAGSPPLPTRSVPAAQPVARKGARTGMVVEHPKYGTGTVVRREGEGDDAKITVNFPRYGLKKLIEKYAGLKRN
jgi:DNA helicase II / ATP-dependent DNA helicase PcrA